MYTNELEAKNNLQTISQTTHYIVDWSEYQPMNRYSKTIDKNIIIEEEDHQSHPTTSRKQR